MSGKKTKLAHLFLGCAFSDQSGRAIASAALGTYKGKGQSKYQSIDVLEDYELEQIKKKYTPKERELLALVIGMHKTLGRIQTLNKPRIIAHTAHAGLARALNEHVYDDLIKEIGELRTTKAHNPPIYALMKRLAEMGTYSVRAELTPHDDERLDQIYKRAQRVLSGEANMKRLQERFNDSKAPRARQTRQRDNQELRRQISLILENSDGEGDDCTPLSS